MKIAFKELNKIENKFWGKMWKKMHSPLFFLAIFAAISAGFFVWHNNLNSQWSQDKQQEYLKAHENEIVFKETEFNQVNSDVKSRLNYANNFQQIKDIFKQY